MEPKPQKIHIAEILSVLILFNLYLCSGLYFVFFGKFWTDENWYYSSSVMTSNGLQPHLDFFAHHNPVFYYVYSIPQYIFGPSFIAGRLTSLFFILCSFILVYIIARRLSGIFAAFLAGAFLTLNFFSTSYFVTVSYHPLESLFMVLFFFFLTCGIKEKYKYSLCTITLLLAVGTRYLTDISVVFLLLFFIFLYLKKKEVSFSLRTQILIACCAFILFIMPYINILERLIFQIIQFNIFSTRNAEDPIYKELIKSVFFFRFLLLEKLTGNFLPVLIVNFSIGTGIIWLGLRDRKRLFQLWNENAVLFLMVIFVTISELFYQIPLISWPVTRLYYFPVACIAAGVFWEKLASSSKDNLLKPAFYILPVVLILFSVFIQEKPAVRASWETAHLNYLGKVANYVAANTPVDAEIFTFDPPFVIEANRDLSLRMLMETWQIFPEMPTEKCRKYGLINIDMILTELNSRNPYALVLKKPGRLDDNGGKGRILIPYRDAIWKSINSNYYLAHSVPMKKDVDGVVNIYFRK